MGMTKINDKLQMTNIKCALPLTLNAQPDLRGGGEALMGRLDRSCRFEAISEAALCCRRRAGSGCA